MKKIPLRFLFIAIGLFAAAVIWWVFAGKSESTPRTSACVLMQEKTTGKFGCFGCGGIVGKLCSDPALGWEIFRGRGPAPSCVEGKYGCEMRK